MLRSVVTATPEAAVGLIETLRMADREADVDLLLQLITTGGPTLCGSVAGAMWTTGSLDDLESLLDRLVSHDLLYLAAAALSCDDAAGLGLGAEVGIWGETGASGSGTGTGANPMTERLLSRPVREFTETIADLHRQARGSEVGDLLEVLSRGSAYGVFAAADELAGNQLMREAKSLMERYVYAADPADLAEFFVRLRSWDEAAAMIAPALAARTDSGRFLAALDASLPDEEADACLARFFGLLEGAGLAALCVGLTEQNANQEFDLVLRWSAGSAHASAIRSALHDAGAHAIAYQFSQRVAELTGRYDS